MIEHNAVIEEVTGRHARWEEAFGRHLPFQFAPRDDIILTRQGDLVASAIVEGLDSFTSNDDEIDEVNADFVRYVAQLGEEFGIYVNKITVPEKIDLPPIPGEDFAAHVDRTWLKALRQKRLKQRILMISIVVQPKFKSGFTASGKFMEFISRMFGGSSDQDWRGRIEQLDEAMARLKGIYQQSGFRRLTMRNGEWLGLLATIFGQEYGRVIAGPGQFLALSMTNIDAHFTGNSFTVETGNRLRHGTVFSIKTYPASTFATMLDSLDLPYDLVITNSFNPIRNNEIEERIERVARQMQATEDAAVSLQEQLMEAADNVASGRQVFGRHHMSVMVLTDSKEDLEEAAAEVFRAGQNAGVLLVREKFAARAAYFAQAPGNWLYRPRVGIVSADNFADMASLHKTCRGRGPDEVPWGQNITVFPTVTASAYRFNFHERGKSTEEPSPGHTLILGRPGAGKTLGVAFLMAQARRVNARIIVFDKDQGLEMAVRALGGDYSAIKVGQPTGLNPFATENDERGAAWLTDWLGDILTRTRPLETNQTVSLNEAVRQIVSSEEALRNFSDFATLVASTDDDGDLVSRVREWTREGRFGWLFDLDQERKIAFDNEITGIDMSEILDLETERAAVLSYLFRRIERQIEDRRPTIIVIDEAWKMLNDSIFVKRLHDWLVTMRKKNTCVVMLTQTPGHLEQSAVGQIIAEIVTTQVLYPNARANRDDYRILRLNDAEAQFVSSSTGGTRLALVRSAGDSVQVNMDLGALGGALAVLGGGRTGENKAPYDWRNIPDFWKEMV